jgi:putative ABC transport system ATP-binding protein
VEKGEFVAVVGASGSGKSTLMHLIGGVDRPTSGGVTIDGNEIFKQNESGLAIFRRRNIGLIYQFYNLIPTLTAEENIMLPRLLDNRKPDGDKLKSILETIGLTERKGHLPGELSGGQQQRVSVGRALINDPALILADEPTGNLDSKSSREIIDLLKLSNKKYGQTLIVITHDEKIALQADRVITVSDGKIVKDEVVRQ